MPTLPQPEQDPESRAEARFVESAPGPVELAKRFATLGKAILDVHDSVVLNESLSDKQNADTWYVWGKIGLESLNLAQVVQSSADKLQVETDNNPSEDKHLEKLTARELEAVLFALQEDRIRTIASKMNVAEQTASLHIRNASRKLGLDRFEMRRMFSAVEVSQRLADKKPSKSRKSKETKSAGKKLGAGRPKLGLTPKELLPTLGVRAAKQLVRMMPPEALESYEEMSFRVGTPDTLSFLLQSGVITEEEFKNGEVSANAAALALITHSPIGRELLEGERAQENIGIASAAARSELERAVREKKMARLGGTGR
jgi:hypothetical protein